MRRRPTRFSARTRARSPETIEGRARGAAPGRYAVLDPNVARDERVVGEGDGVTDDGVVGDVNAYHQQTIRADCGGPAILRRAAVNRHVLAKDVAIADDEPRRLPGVRAVLGLASENCKGMKHVVFADERRPQHHR